MIGKIKNLPGGDHLIRLAVYLMGPQGERVASHHAINLSASDIDGNVLLMDAQAGLSRRAKKPFMHITVSYAPTDLVSSAEMQADAQRVLSALGAEQAQAFMVVHNDKAYQHFHLVMNRVGEDGRCISDSNSKRKVEAVLRKIEAERGLRVVPGRHTSSGPDATHFKGARAARRGYVKPPAAVVEAMSQARSRQELDRRLGQLGWRLDDVQPKRGQKAGGLVLRGPAGAMARASDCGRDCSGPALARRFSAPMCKPLEITTAGIPPLPVPKPNGAHALAAALRKSKIKTKPRIPRIAPSQSVTGIIRRVIPVAGPRLKF